MRIQLTLATILLATSLSAHAQQPTGASLAGTVKAVSGDEVTITTKDGDVTVTVTPQTRLMRRHDGNLDDIKPGAYLGTSNQNGAAANSGTATEVHVMERGPNVNFAMNDKGLTMTNGHVTAVTKTDKGQEMDIDYGQGTKRHVVVTKSTTLTKMDSVHVGDLKAGTKVTGRYLPGEGGKHMADVITFDQAK